MTYRTKTGTGCRARRRGWQAGVVGVTHLVNPAGTSANNLPNIPTANRAKSSKVAILDQPLLPAPAYHPLTAASAVSFRRLPAYYRPPPATTATTAHRPLLTATTAHRPLLTVTTAHRPVLQPLPPTACCCSHYRPPPAAYNHRRPPPATTATTAHRPLPTATAAHRPLPTATAAHRHPPPAGRAHRAV